MSDRSSLPYTEGMLATATDIFVVLPIATKIAGVELTIPLTAAIGTIERLERRNTRRNTRRYSLGKHAFEPLDIIPGPIDTELTLTKIVLYRDTYGFPATQQLEAFGLKPTQIAEVTKSLETNGEFQGLFGITSGNVLYQQKPIHIQVINYDHSGVEDNNINKMTNVSINSGWDKDVANNKITSITYYWNCWIKDNPISYNLQNAGNILVKQDINVDVGRVETYEPNLSRVLTSTVASVLPTSITF